MTISGEYAVVTTGQIVSGFEPADVRGHLVSILKLTTEQAERFFEKPRVLKKGVSWANADRLCGQLGKIGVGAEIQNPVPTSATQNPEPPRASREEPALELVQDEAEPAPQQAAGTVECPSCHHVQPKSEQCESCGIWFHKLEPSVSPAAPSSQQPENSPTAPPAAAAPADDSIVSTSRVASEAGEFGLMALGVAAGAALLGALVWKFIAVTFAYEFGLIAWGIGGAVGAAAAAAGSRGMQAGIVCALLAFGAIVLGKYWAYSAFVDEFQDVITDVSEYDEEMYAYYEEELEDARLFVRGSGSDIFVRRFMVERGYAYTDNPADISDAEVTEFRDYIEPDLREMAQNPPSFDEWQAGYAESLDDFSPWAMMREDFGVLDILFIFLGVGTAFRVASQWD